MSLLLFLTLLATGLYLAAGLGLGLRLARGAGGRRLSLALGTAAVALHAAALLQMVWAGGGLNLGFFNALSLTGWLMGLTLLVAVPRHPVADLGIVVFPLTGLTALADVAFANGRAAAEPLAVGLDIHVTLAILAYAVLGVAAVQAGLLAIQERQLRLRRPGGFIRRLPPLQTMEALLFLLVRVGFALLTVGLVSGWLFVEDLFAQHLVHKTVLSMVAWLVFGILLWGRYRFGWRGQTATRWTLGGFAVLALAFFGSKAVLELILQR